MDWGGFVGGFIDLTDRQNVSHNPSSDEKANNARKVAMVIARVPLGLTAISVVYLHLDATSQPNILGSISLRIAIKRGPRVTRCLEGVRNVTL